MKERLIKVLIVVLLGGIAGGISATIVGSYLGESEAFTRWSISLIENHGGAFWIPREATVDNMFFLLDPIAFGVGLFVALVTCIASLVMSRLGQKKSSNKNEETSGSN